MLASSAEGSPETGDANQAAVKESIVPTRDSHKDSRSSLQGSTKTSSPSSSSSSSSSPSSSSFFSSGSKKRPHFSQVMYSLPVPNCTPKPGQSIPRRHPLVINDASLPTTYDASVTTLHDIFQSSVRHYGDRPFMGTRPMMAEGQVGPYEWLSYAEAGQLVEQLASAFASWGLTRGQSVGLFSVNRYEWVVAEYACFAQSLITVPLYDTLGTQSILHICNQTQMTCVVATLDKALTLLKLAKDVPHIRRVVVMDRISEELQALAATHDISLILFSEALQLGRDAPVEARPPTASDVFTICYTSGTTGLPKGAVFPHSAMVAMLTGITMLIDNNLVIRLHEAEVHLSYLPLAHIFERVIMALLVKVGATVGFFQGDTLKILDDVAALRPTVFVSVPRLYNRIYDKVLAGVKAKGSISQFLFNMAYESKLKALRQGHLSHWLWDRLVFAPIKARLGGRVRAMITGSAPIAAPVMDFLRVAFSCEVYEGYGQTETCAASCLTQLGDYKNGHVGGPTPTNEVMLFDVPEMSYSASGNPPRGEICFRGPSCFSLYYEEPEKTAETIDEDGWVHSGDIGQWDEQGRLSVIDRKKNIFKLSQGEYIAPEKIENILSQAALVEQIFVYGDSLKASLVAVIVPDHETLFKQLPSSLKHDLPPSCVDSAAAAFEHLYEHHYDQLVSLVLADIGQFGRASPLLKGFEIPKGIYLEKKPFSVQNNLLTSTFKLKRFEATRYYKANIDQLYRSLA